MTPGLTIGPAAESSPSRIARLAGAFYLLTIITGIFAQAFVSGRLVVPTDATATAANILARESFFRLGFTVYLIEMICQIVMTSLLYDLLKPVSRPVALLAAMIGFIGCTIKIVARLFFIAPLLVLGNAPYLAVFDAAQRPALALLLLQINDQGAAMALAFFGVYALLKGWLVLRSEFLPRWLGIVTIVSGLGWLAFLFPPLGYRLFGMIAPLGLIGALANIGWMLVYGVDDERWRARAREATTSLWS